jgi:hypothetical protein
VKDLSRIMMSKKTKRLYQRMQYGLEKKSEASKKLDEKLKQLESQSNSDSHVTENGSKKSKRQGSTTEGNAKKSKKAKN